MPPINARSRKKKHGKGAPSTQSGSNHHRSRSNSASKTGTNADADSADQGVRNTHDRIKGLGLEGAYKIGASRSNVQSHWKSLSTEEKRELISLSEEDVMGTIEKILQRKLDIPFTPDQRIVSSVQAAFLQAMETDGIVELIKSSLEATAVLVTLESKLLMEIVKKDIHTKSLFVFLFFLWISSWPWIGLTSAAYISLSKLDQCVQLRDLFCRATEVFFIHHEDPNLVEWQAHSYIAAILLLYLTSGTSLFVLMAILLFVPYVVCAIENRESLSSSYTDQVGLKNIRVALSYLNKLILVYYAWGAYSSLILVCTLFFAQISISILSFAAFSVSIVIGAIASLLKRIVPLNLRLSFISWRQRSAINGLIVTFLPLPFAAVIVWYTWQWGSPWGGLTRATCFIVTAQLLPSRASAILLNGGLVLLALPIKIIHVVLTRTINMWTSVVRTTKEGEQCQDDKKSTRYDFDFTAPSSEPFHQN